MMTATEQTEIARILNDLYRICYRDGDLSKCRDLGNLMRRWGINTGVRVAKKNGRSIFADYVWRHEGDDES